LRRYNEYDRQKKGEIEMSGFGVLIISLICIVVVIAISVAIMRWIFRINVIVDRLDEMIELMDKQTGVECHENSN